MVSSKPSQRHSHQSESYVDRREIIEEIIIVTKCGMRDAGSGGRPTKHGSKCLVSRMPEYRAAQLIAL